MKTVMFLVIPAEREIPVQLIMCGTQVLLFFFFLRSLFVFSVASIDHSEKAMATYSSTLAWKLPWTEESGRL